MSSTYRFLAWRSMCEGRLVHRAIDWHRVVLSGRVAGEWNCGACLELVAEFESASRPDVVADCTSCGQPNRIFDRTPEALRPPRGQRWTDHAFVTAGGQLALWTPSSEFSTRAPGRCFGCGDWGILETRQAVADHARNCTSRGVALAA